MRESINPYAPPASEVYIRPQDPPGIWAILSKAWQIFRARFVATALVVKVIWVP